MSFHDFIFGFDESKIMELQKNQNIFHGKLQNLLGSHTDLSGTVTGISDKVTGASNTAKSALDTAEAASKTADAVSTTAQAALSTADAASTTAQAASMTADIASTTANTALSTADAASSTASTALNQTAELSAQFAEAMGDSDKIVLYCTVGLAVAVTFCFVLCFLYGVKHAKEEEGKSSPADQDTQKENQKRTEPFESDFPQSDLSFESSVKQPLSQSQQRPIAVF